MLWPTRGLDVSSALAVYECKLYAFRMLHSRRQLSIVISLHVEDLSIYIEETIPSNVAEVICPSLDQLRVELPKARLTISPSKEGLTATNAETFGAVAYELACFNDNRRQVSHRLHDTPGKLGLDYLFARRRISGKGSIPTGKRKIVTGLMVP
jgi:hypothetical protein